MLEAQEVRAAAKTPTLGELLAELAMRFSRFERALRAKLTSPVQKSWLESLKTRGPEQAAEREALTRALLHRYQTTLDPSCAEVLALAYLPMLSRLCSRFEGAAFERNELEQMVLLSFWEVLRTYPLDRRSGWTCLGLKRLVEKRVTNEHAAERGHTRGRGSWDEVGEIGARPRDPTARLDLDRAYLALQLMPESSQHLLGGTLFVGTSVREYLRANGKRHDRKAIERFKRRHSRDHARLLSLLEDPVSPSSVPTGLGKRRTRS